MFGPNRDSAWAWGTLAVAMVASLVAAPWDADIRSVAIDGSIPDDAIAAEGAGSANVLAGAAAGDVADASGPTGVSGASTASGATAGTSSTTVTTAGSGTSTSGSGTATTGSSPGATEADPSPGPGTTNGGPAPQAPAGSGGGENGKGVTDTQVRIGFTDLVGQQDAAGQLGFDEALPNPGNTKAQIRAMIDWANANGGIAGREAVPIIKEIRFAESSDSGEEGICTSMREDQDQDVFAAVLIGTIRERMRQCLAEGGIITLDPSAFPMTGYLYDDTVIDGVPYLWSPSYPTLNDTAEVLAQHLDAMGYFEPLQSTYDPCVAEPCRLGLLMYDFPNYNRLLEEVLGPRFEAIGHPIESVQKVDSRDAASIEAGLGNALLGFQRDGISRVIFMGGAPLGPFFMVDAAAQGYTPVYGVTSFDQPRFATDNSQSAPNQAHSMRGIGFAPTLDVHEDKYDHGSEMETQCLGIYEAAGITFSDRANARVGMAYCESVLMLKTVGDRLGGDLTAEAWSKQAATLGDSFQTVDGFRTFFSSEKRAGSAAFRRFQVMDDCYCTEYVSDLYDFVGP